MSWLKEALGLSSKPRFSGSSDSGSHVVPGRSARFGPERGPIEVSPSASTQPIQIAAAAIRATPEPMALRPQAPIPTHAVGTILLVDGERPWRDRIAEFLQSRDFMVTVCSTVEEALSYHGPISFAFVALELPDRPGWQIWNRLCTDSREPQVLFWGADAQAWERLSFRFNPRVHFIAKPFNSTQLSQAMMELERRRRY